MRAPVPDRRWRHLPHIWRNARESSPEPLPARAVDAALINVAQAAEHCEIAHYGSLIAWAKQLGRNDCGSILQKTLDEERATDKKLTTLAESKVNLRAASGSFRRKPG
jgi:ferritin-like metal-binding protein YciE